MQRSSKVVFLLLISGSLATHGGPPAQTSGRSAADVQRLLVDADNLALEYRLESTNAALRKYEEAIHQLEAINDGVTVTRTMIRIANLYRDLGDTQQWGKYAESASARAKVTEDRLLEADALLTYGTALFQRGDRSRAGEVLSRLLEIGRSFPNTQAEAQASYFSGVVSYLTGEAGTAEDAFQKAAGIWDRLNDPSGVAEAELYLAAVDALTSRAETALVHAQKSISLFRFLKNRRGETHALTVLGNLQTRLGRKQDALNFYEQARALLNGSGDLVNEQRILFGMARTYLDLGDADAALRFYGLALEKSTALSDASSIADAEKGIGQSYVAKEQARQALPHLVTALNIFEKVSNRRAEAFALRDVGIVYETIGDNARAIEYLTQSIERSRALPDRRLEASALVAVGHVYEAQGNRERALDYYRQADELSTATQDTFGRVSALFHSGECLRALGKFDEALTDAETALGIIEQLRSTVANSALRTSYFSSVRQQYDLLIDLLMRLRKADPTADEVRALETSERSRARTLIDNIAETRVSISEGVDPKQLEREINLRSALDANVERYTQLRAANPAATGLQQLNDEVQRLTKEYEELQGQIRVRSPRYAALVQPEPLRLLQIQKDLLDQNSLLLEYSVGEENTYLWAVTKDQFSSYVLPKRDEIDKRVRRLRELLAARVAMPNEKPADFQARVKAAEAQYPRAAAELSQMLLGPVAEKLDDKRLVIVGEGVLQYLPFGALPTPQSAQSASPVPLVFEHEIVNLPSASTLAVIRREAPMRGTPDRTLAVFADPVFEMHDARVRRPAGPKSTPVATIAQTLRGSDAVGPKIDFPRLPSSKQEAEAILSMVPEDSRMGALGFKATKAAAMSPELKRYRIVHFATHTVLDDDHPDLSSLVLSLVDEKGSPQSGFLRLRDMYNLSLSAELVVLSACETALGKEVKGEGLMSMVRGFMYSGTPRVLASLWKVDDEATAELMKEFYKQLLEGGLTPAAALRQAQIAQMQKKSRQSPYYWAGFQLQGEWR